MSLLVCIACHYNAEREVHLNTVVQSLLSEYKTPISIIIDTQTPDLNYLSGDNVRVVIHSNLSHPFDLVYMHRNHIKEENEKYKYFMYIEHDMYIPYKSYTRYLENFQLLYPNAFPGLVRLEKKDDEWYVIDAIHRHNLKRKTLIRNKWFVSLHNPYYASWILPVNVLMDTMPSNFYSFMEESKDFTERRIDNAAAYLIRELQKPILIELEDGKISDSCLSYHLTNKYVFSKSSRFGKIKLNELLY